MLQVLICHSLKIDFSIKKVGIRASYTSISIVGNHNVPSALSKRSPLTIEFSNLTLTGKRYFYEHPTFYCDFGKDRTDFPFHVKSSLLPPFLIH